MQRGFVEVDGRLVHFRQIGRGPPLVLLHGSPNSARALRIEALAASTRLGSGADETLGSS